MEKAEGARKFRPGVRPFQDSTDTGSELLGGTEVKLSMLRSAKALFSTQTGEAVVRPEKVAAQLRPEHLVCDPSNLRHPATLQNSDFTPE